MRIPALADAGILTSLQLSECVFDWILLESRACLLKLKVKDRSLCLLQVYASNAVSEYRAFVDDVNDALQRVGSTESTILLVDFNGTDSETWKDVIGRHGDLALNENGQNLLQLCCSNGLCVMNTSFKSSFFQSLNFRKVCFVIFLKYLLKIFKEK